MALRFPGAASQSAFWTNLVAGVESLTLLDDETLLGNGAEHSDLRDPDYVRLRPTIGDVERFDPAYFGITAREAELLNPQHRLFMEICDEVLQRAGLDPARDPARVGVYGGASPNRYADRAYSRPDLVETVGEMAIEISNQPDYLATHVSHLLGLDGPSVNVQTACSTALVAIHLARTAILNGECDVALAGGVSVDDSHDSGVRWTPNSIFARDGHCRPFDAAAAGTNFGSGAGVVLLKRLDAAVADGDQIHAVLRHTVINNDGADRGAFTSPSRGGQVRLLRDLFGHSSSIAPSSIGYVEAHGTGTAVGDPVEFQALTEAFDIPADGRWRCPIGSVKGNIGHLGPAAGIAGFIKAVLALREGVVPRSINFTRPNPAIDMEASPFYVAVSEEPLGERRRAMVSSFGIGGTNAVAVVDAPPERSATLGSGATAAAWGKPLLLPVSGTDPGALGTYAALLAAHLRGGGSLPAAARLLQVGRKHQRVRQVVVASDEAEAIRQLGLVTDGIKARPGRRSALLFPGQGAQFPGMAAGLEALDGVTDTLDEVLRLVREHGGPDLAPLLFDPAADERLLRRTDHAQPALFALEAALGRWWMETCGSPSVMVGHSVGEFAAAWLAGVFTLPAAVRAVVERGSLMQAMETGDMMAVTGDIGLVVDLLPGTLSIAARNGSRSGVVAGRSHDIEAFAARLDALGLNHVRLHTSHAFHTPMMADAANAFRDVLSDLQLSPPNLTIVSTATGRPLTAEEACSPQYWADQIVRPVQFWDAIRAAVPEADVLVEAGPGTVLSSLARPALSNVSGGTRSQALLPRDVAPDTRAARALSAVGAWWETGGTVDWDTVSAPVAPVAWADVPRYPHRRDPYWIEFAEGVAESDVGDEHGPAARPLEESTYAALWHGEELADGARPALLDACWLVLDTDGAGLARAAEAAGATVVRVRPGVSFAARSAQEFEVRVGSREDMARVMTETAAAGLTPSVILGGWSLPDAGLDASTATPEARAFFSMLHAYQAFTEQWPAVLPRVGALSYQGVSVTGSERVEPAGALWHGASRVLSNEVPGLVTCCIDVDASTPAAVAVDELAAPHPPALVAHRGRRRWTRRYQPVPLREPAGPSIDPEGVYVVTGGTGGLGLEVARFLVSAGPVSVALLSRRGPSALGYADELLTEPSAEGAIAVTELQALATLKGARIAAIAADVTDPDSLAASIGRVRELFGPIAGAFHVAGVAGGGLAALRSDSDAQRVLDAKVSGAENLLSALGDEPRFVAMFGSIIGATGDVGMVDYAAANAYLDALADVPRERSPRVLTIDWCGWTDVGMLVDNRDSTVDAIRAQALGYRQQDAGHPLLESWTSGHGHVAFTARWEPVTEDFLDDHNFGGPRVVSATTLLEMMRGAAAAAAGGPVEMVDIVFGAAVLVQVPSEVQLLGEPSEEAGSYGWQVSYRPVGSHEPWVTCAVGRSVAAREVSVPPVVDLASLTGRFRPAGTPHLSDDVAPMLFGERWRAVEEVLVGDGDQLVRASLPAAARAEGYVLHPALLDNATSLGLELALERKAFLPASYERVWCPSPLPPTVLSHIRRREATDPERITYDVTLYDEQGRTCAEISGFTVLLHASVPADAPGEGLLGERPAERTAPVGPSLDDFCVTPEEGLVLLGRVLAQERYDRIAISREPLQERLDRDRSKALAGPGTAAPDTAESDPPEETEPGDDAELTETETAVRRLWQAALGRRDIDVDDDFYDLGGNSLVAVQLLMKLRSQFSLKLSGNTLLEHPSVHALAAHIDMSRS